MAVIGISDDRGTTMCAGGVMVSIVPIQEVGRGSIPTAALNDLRLIPISR